MPEARAMTNSLPLAGSGESKQVARDYESPTNEAFVKLSPVARSLKEPKTNQFHGQTCRGSNCGHRSGHYLIHNRRDVDLGPLEALDPLL